MEVLLVWPTQTLQSCRHCHPTEGGGCSLYGLVWVLQRCCQFLAHEPCHISKFIAHCSSCHGYRSLCSCPWEEMNCWIALTVSPALFHSSTLLRVLRAQSCSPQVSVCLMLKYSLVWHQASVFLCLEIVLLPFPRLRIICLLHSMFQMLKGMGRQDPAEASGRPPGPTPRCRKQSEEVLQQLCVSAYPAMAAGLEVLLV